MNIIPGTKKIKKGTVTASAEIQCLNGYTIHVFPGSLSKYDILLKYKSCKSNRLRTPQHIHWAVDLLLKKSADETSTNALLVEIYNFWTSCSILTGNSFIDVESVVKAACSCVDLTKYSSLDSKGEYPVEFLFILMCLLATQEKTNATAGGKTAHMFGDVLNELKKNDLDIFKIMSTAGFGGR